MSKPRTKTDESMKKAEQEYSDSVALNRAIDRKLTTLLEIINDPTLNCEQARKDYRVFEDALSLSLDHCDDLLNTLSWLSRTLEEESRGIILPENIIGASDA